MSVLLHKMRASAPILMRTYSTQVPPRLVGVAHNGRVPSVCTNLAYPLIPSVLWLVVSLASSLALPLRPVLVCTGYV